MDGCPADTALREAKEEIGLNPDQANILGSLSLCNTSTGWYVTPIVATIPYPYKFNTNKRNRQNVHCTAEMARQTIQSYITKA